MDSLQEARTLGPLCERSLILRHLKDIRGDRPAPKLRIWGSEVRNPSGRASSCLIFNIFLGAGCASAHS
jgi:hypothetical protein